MSARDHQITVRPLDVAAGEAGDLAAELRELMLADNPPITAELNRADPRAQDFGALLVVTAPLLAPALTAIAHGLGRWLAKHNDASVEVSDGSRTLTVRHISGRGAKELASQLAEIFDESAGS
ncbi:hypothetical protein [Frankia sp. Cas3]|uniref:hypothetical protein n=1 Tax=Frankia sp. Cas3 TaxID=3073926 RepID=UPI002AD4244D|nr:hypothetical protein [Frankia sp. Cas3]